MTTYTNNNTGTFSSASSKIRDHVLEDYLAAKIANYVGIRRDDVNDATVIRIPANYANSEGVIKGMELVKGLRVDLQAAQVHGGNRYATWQVQWGTGSGGKNGGAYAGVLMRVDTDFTFAEFRQAMRESFGYTPGAYCRLDP
ncbi:hypothetical protein [Xanthomonas albilineans]|uniref:hypothetical protein n=1 Tax=Xanthomonas albilineans TaxID=29447 RepID=UPI0005F3279C|nr:hypothetical protein [Xanthomonas albilineans]PPU93909.1 hypothetical protein XalbCFBP2523_05620 [Xanthomonas albilineans]